MALLTKIQALQKQRREVQEEESALIMELRYPTHVDEMGRPPPKRLKSS